MARSSIGYRHDGGRVLLESTQLDVARGPQTLRPKVDLGPCLANPRRQPLVANAFPLLISLVLDDGRGGAIDSVDVGPMLVRSGAAPTPITATLREVLEVRVTGLTRDTLGLLESAQLSVQSFTRADVRVPERECDVVGSSSDPTPVSVSASGQVRALRSAIGPGVTINARIGDRVATRGAAGEQCAGEWIHADVARRSRLRVRERVAEPGVASVFRWASSNPAIASIAAGGTLTPLAFVTTNISLPPRRQQHAASIVRPAKHGRFAVGRRKRKAMDEVFGSRNMLGFGTSGIAARHWWIGCSRSHALGTT